MSKKEPALAAYGKSYKKMKTVKSGEKMKQRMKKQRAEAVKIKEFIEDMKSKMESRKSFETEGEDMVKKIEREFARIKEQIKLQSKMILWGELLADYIQNEYNILP